MNLNELVYVELSPIYKFSPSHSLAFLAEQVYPYFRIDQSNYKAKNGGKNDILDFSEEDDIYT
jgi:hypothetical protein